MTEIYNAKKAAPRGQAKAERVAGYGAMRFEEYAGEWKAGQRDPGPASVDSARFTASSGADGG
ncbi:hypothetical protein [Streptomyces sp. NPDC058678]|uniref:hypothetical protein n=1 Tax=Streptomyces sp. NPDC058678 TaxID=3346595 RepID=UPI003658E094